MPIHIDAPRAWGLYRPSDGRLVGVSLLPLEDRTSDYVLRPLRLVDEQEWYKIVAALDALRKRGKGK